MSFRLEYFGILLCRVLIICIMRSFDTLHTAFSSLYLQYADVLLSYGYGLGYEKEDIEDAMQDVFFNLYSKNPSLGGINNIKFYLFYGLKNRLLNSARNKRVGKIVDIEEVDFITEVSISDEMIADEESRAIKERVEKGLAQLTSRQREAIYLRYINELEYDDIARLLNMTKPSVRNLVFRALKEMRENMPDTQLFSLILMI